MSKIFGIVEAAKLLGLSISTIRRKIRDNELIAVKRSNKEGYQISDESIRNYAQKHRSILNPLLIGIATSAAMIPLANLFENKITSPKANNSFQDSETDNDILENLTDKIERLKFDETELDLKIQYLELELQKNDSASDVFNIQETILALKMQQLQVKKEIYSLSVQKNELSKLTVSQNFNNDVELNL